MNKNVLKHIVLWIGAILCLVVAIMANATPSGTAISGMTGHITSQFKAIGTLLTAGSYLAGLGFAIGAIVKFKAHKDSPQQTPIGMPIALLFVAAALMFLPSVYHTAGKSIYSGGVVGGPSGISSW